MHLEMADAAPGLTEVLSERDVAKLIRRAAGARGLALEANLRSVRGMGGLALDVTTNPGREWLVWATVGEDDGLLGLFSGDRLLTTPPKELGAILRVQPVSLPGLPHRAIMVDDRYEEAVGAFLTEEHRRIYVWDGRGLREVYRGTLASEQYTHARWDNPRAPQVWRLVRSTGNVMLSGGSIVEERLDERLEAPGSAKEPIPAASRFRVTSRAELERRLRWDPRLRRFEPM